MFHIFTPFHSVYILLMIVLANALYEDQIGKFDWKKEFVGKVEDATFDSSISVSKHVYVSTSKNILACISTRTGKMLWRKILESSDGKIIHLKHIKDGLLTVTANGLSRVWDSGTGILKWEVDLSATFEKREEYMVYDVAVLERSYTEGNLLIALSSNGLQTVSLAMTRRKPEVHSIDFDQTLEDSRNNKLYVDSSSGQVLHLQLQSGARLIVGIYTVGDLEYVSQVTIDTAWLDSLDMVSILEDNTLIYLSNEDRSISLVDAVKGNTKSTESFSSLGIDTSVSSFISNQNKDIASRGYNMLVRHGTSQVTCLKMGSLDNIETSWTKSLPGLHDVTVMKQGGEVYAFMESSSDMQVTVLAVDMKTGATDESRTIKYKIPQPSFIVDKTYINMYLKTNAPIGFRVLLTCTDESIRLIGHPNRALWSRDEALASTLDAVMLDLPLSDVDAGIEAEFEENGRTKLADMFVKRVKAQGNQLLSWIKQTIKEFNEDPLMQSKTRDPLIKEEGLTRDSFNLHKMIVAVTKPGALFGIDSLSGAIIWRFFSEKLSDRKLHFYVQRTTAHFPNPPQALLLALDPSKSLPPILMKLNPIIGSVEDVSEKYSNLKAPLLQSMLSPFPDSHYLRPLILLDENLKVHLIPDTAEVRDSLKNNKLFMYDVNPDDGQIRGFSVDGGASAQLVWSLNILPSHKIITFVGKHPLEKVDSVGRPLADRSVIYKYLNPNLIVVLSESTDRSVDRSSLMLLLIDTVTGQVVHSAIHKKSSGPVHIVHSENWLLYSYWNTKARRTEIASMELYEGKAQYNSTSFSSFHSRPTPLIIHQAYIFSTGISSMGVTRTEKGITSRQILLGLKRGSLLGIPRRFFDPRRPLRALDTHREEGLIEYMPEIPIPPELFLSYNLSVEGIDKIYSAPAALESTSLILITGLDMFFTRSQPSKMFDVLKEDFDHLFISAVLILMLVGALVTRRFSQIKQLKKAWR